MVRARCGDIEEALQNLEKFRAMSAEALLANRDFADASLGSPCPEPHTARPLPAPLSHVN